MRRAVAIVLLLLAFAGAPAAFAAEEPDAESLVLPIEQIDHSAHPEVTVTVTVPRELVGLNLRPEDFFVSENNEARALDVMQLPSEELAVVLVLDTSGSMRGEALLAAKRAVDSFLQQMPPGVEIALVSFGDTARLDSQFTEDYDAILDAIGPLQATGETALYNAVLLGSNLFDNIEAPRRAMILLSDGGDTASTIELEDALIALLDAGPRFIAVELESSENDSATLQRIEAATTGTLVSASDPTALTEIYEETASDLVNQYELTFTSQAEGITNLVVAVRRGEVAAIASTRAQFPPLPILEEPEAPVVAEPEPIFVPTPPVVALDVPWIATPAGLAVAALAIFSALAVTFLLMVPTRQGGLAFFGLVGRRPRGESRFSGLAASATMFAEEALSRSHGDRAVRKLLDRAGIRLRIGEFLVLLVGVGIAAFAAAFAFLNLTAAAVIAVTAVFAAIALISAIGARRAEKFRSQLPDTLQLIAGSLRAGFGLTAAIGAVADEQEDPTAEEFNRMQIEVQLGRTIEESLRAAAIRVQSEDLPWVADAIEIHRETGGDVADLLDGIAATVRERERVRGQIKVLSAEGRISGLVLILMPFVLAAITYFAAPGYFAELTDSTEGRWMIAGALFDMFIGIIWIRQITRLRY